MSDLASRSCIPCQGGIPRVEGGELERLAAEVPRWTVAEARQLELTIRVPDFAASLAIANRIGALAEAEGHHPDLTVAWGRLAIVIWTHAVDGLTESDFVLAAKIDRLLQEEAK